MKRIAIYARKSVMSDKGDSIKNQIDKCNDLIKYKYGDEKVTIAEYDQDEGFTGSNINRPDYQRMVRDIKKGKIDVLVCYKLDRLSRSVADFSELLKILNQYGVSFHSATEAIDTMTAMGEAMVQIIMVFAQLERRTIAERITDNMYSLAKTDRWVSGKPPLGYKLNRIENEKGKKQTQLEIDEESIQRVKLIFSKYVELRSLNKLDSYLLQNHVKSQNEKDLQASQIALILRNPVYVKADERVKDFYVRQGAQFYGDVDGECGLMSYGKRVPKITESGTMSTRKADMENWIISVGTHKGIIDADIWLETQRLMSENKGKFPQIQKSHTALVSGILRCAECGSPMGVVYGHKQKDGNKGYYYVCTMRKRSKGERCTNPNISASLVDEAVRNELRQKSVDRGVFLAKLHEKIAQNKNEIQYNPVERIREDIKENEKQIKNLIQRISKTDNDDIAVEYEGEIIELKKEIATLQAKLSFVGDKKSSVFQTEQVIAFVTGLLDKCGHVDNMELDEQRELVQALYKRITWNSHTYRIAYEHISDNDDDEGNKNGLGGGYASLGAVVMGDEQSHNFQSMFRQVQMVFRI